MSYAILSTNVFTATGTDPIDGYVEIDGSKILAVGDRRDIECNIERFEYVIDCGDKVVMPGLVDDHTFFSGWALLHLGADLEGLTSMSDVLVALDAWKSEHPDAPMVLGRGVSNDMYDAMCASCPSIDESNTPIALFTQDRSRCYVNASAVERYGFSPDECWSEMIWRLIEDALELPEVPALYFQYMRLLNSRGVTTIKEMAYDDYRTFIDRIVSMADRGDLTVRISLQSQPVGRGMDIPAWRRIEKRLDGVNVNFTGFNQMTDRGISSGKAELIDPYTSHPEYKVATPVDWAGLERDVHEADSAGYRYTLHCQGDGAVRKTVRIYESCRRDASGRLVNRHGITDLENSNPSDLIDFGAMGGICEIYPQIQCLDSRDELIDMLVKQVGPARMPHYWNRRGMEDAGCTVACGTDLPLLIPHIGESIYCACGGYFDDGKSYNQNNTLTLPELLRAWTYAGAFDCGMEKITGTLEPGKYADICVLSKNVFSLDPDVCRDVTAVMTVVSGRVVFNS